MSPDAKNIQTWSDRITLESTAEMASLGFDSGVRQAKARMAPLAELVRRLNVIAAFEKTDPHAIISPVLKRNYRQVDCIPSATNINSMQFRADDEVLVAEGCGPRIYKKDKDSWSGRSISDVRDPLGICAIRENGVLVMYPDKPAGFFIYSDALNIWTDLSEVVAPEEPIIQVAHHVPTDSIVASHGNIIEIIDFTADGFKKTEQFPKLEADIGYIHMKPNGDIFTSIKSGNVMCWRKAQGAYQLVGFLFGSGGGVECIRHLPNGAVITAGSDHNVRVYTENASGEWESEVNSVHKFEVRQVQALQDGRFISLSGDNTMRLWERKENWTQEVLLEVDDIKSFQFLSDGKIALLPRHRNVIEIYDGEV